MDKKALQRFAHPRWLFHGEDMGGAGADEHQPAFPVSIADGWRAKGVTSIFMNGNSGSDDRTLCSSS